MDKLTCSRPPEAGLEGATRYALLRCSLAFDRAGQREWGPPYLGLQSWELRCPPTGTGTDDGEATAATWPWFSAMHEAIGGRPSIKPPILIDSCDAEVAICAAVSTDSSSSPPASVSQRSVEEEEVNSGHSATNSLMQKDMPLTSSDPSPAKKRRLNRVLDFLQQESKKVEERFLATHELMVTTTNRFLDLFEQLIKKN
ncbi:hypothetical protein IRJ41_021122 [Triplophysa rosa]|uniref:Uncharacterized protein n=1 Tax=Triplophysa rosa TaxID=992332 RepID=A0A9W7X6D3_TRIRA|nr:hypothetical protein IRJ41_021122 [Triplophysa rosa]